MMEPVALDRLTPLDTVLPEIFVVGNTSDPPVTFSPRTKNDIHAGTFYNIETETRLMHCTTFHETEPV